MVITDNAKFIIENFLQQKDAEGLRFYSAGGCCTPQYAMTTEDPQDTDSIEFVNGIRIAFDAEVGDTEELTLDMEEDEEGAGLVLLGVKSSGCGCGGAH